MLNKLNINKTSWLFIISALIIGWLLAWLFFSFSSSSESSAERKPLYWVAPMDPNFKRDKPGKSPMGMDLIPVYQEGGSEQDTAGTITISAAVVQNLGVRTAPVIQEQLQRQIQTVGYISFAENRLTHFHSRVDGWIEKLTVTAVGDPVKQGQPLFELYSPKLVTAGEEYIAALSSGSNTLINAAERKLASLGLEPTQIKKIRRTRSVPQRQSFFADQDGYIAALNVREGMFIQPATAVLSIGGLDSVWVIAEIFERQAGWVAEGQTVTMAVSSYPGQQWQGEVDYVYPVVNAQTRTVQARIKFANPDYLLKPDMFAELIVDADYRDAAITVPREAVIRDGQMSRVVKVEGDGRYRSVRVVTGIESGDRVEVLKGLKANDEVVISAQFMLDSESSITADLSRIEGEPEKSNPSRVWVEGKIESLATEQRKASITHSPVKEWGWPTMTMDFIFADDVDLDQLKAGQMIQFCLDRLSDQQYRITAIDRILSEAESTQQEVMPHDSMNHSNHNHKQMLNQEHHHD